MKQLFRSHYRRSRWQKTGCTGKLHYNTLDEAEQEIDRAKTFRGETLRAYLCSLCGSFHLTSQPKRAG